jgi:hypothetical protein
MMKKTIVLLAAALCASGLAAAGRIQASLAANALFPADPAYRETYAAGLFLPELKAAYALGGDLYAWAGFGWVSASGETPVLKMPAESRQGYLAVGGGYRLALAASWGLFGELGLGRIAFREEALEQTVSGSALGVVLNAGARRDLGRRFFLLAQLGYVYGKKTVEDVAVKLGGVKAGIGAGVRF